VAKITKAQLKQVAEKKMPDLNTTDINQAMKIIEGTAKNMGIEVE
jgi:large subunit ribosomal protein L11